MADYMVELRYRIAVTDADSAEEAINAARMELEDPYFDPEVVKLHRSFASGMDTRDAVTAGDSHD